MTMGRTSHSSCHQCRGLKMHQRIQTGKKLRKSYFWNCPLTCSDQHYYSSKPKSVILSKFFTSPQNRVHPQQTRGGRGTLLALVPVQIQNSSPQQSSHLGSQCCILQQYLSDFVFNLLMSYSKCSFNIDWQHWLWWMHEPENHPTSNT